MSNHALNGAGANQRRRPNPSSNVTGDELVSPVTAEELAYFIGLGAPSIEEGDMLDELLLMACDQFIGFANRELLTRDYTLRFDRNPERQPGYGGLSPVPALLVWWTALPLTPVTAVTEVRLSDVPTLNYQEDLATVPARVQIDQLQSGSVEIDYTAGYATAAEIPKGILVGIKSYASYVFDHRGDCDGAEAMRKSGAMAAWQRHKMIVGGL